MSRGTILLLIALTANYSTVNSGEPDIVQQVGFGRQANVIVDSLPETYMPYTPGQRVPLGWRCVTINVPVIETCTKTVCEEQVVQVPKEVPCTVCKEVRIPTEVYKTYVKFKEVRVEDGVLEKRSDSPAGELDELERKELERKELERKELERKERETNQEDTVGKQVSRVGGDNDGGRMIPVAAPLRSPKNVQEEPAESGPKQDDQTVPVTKYREKTVRIHVPVTKIVEVDEGCWREITTVPPCSCGVPNCADRGGCKLMGGAKAKPKTCVRRVWEPKIVQREVTVLEMCETTIHEPYTDAVPQPAPDQAAETVPDQAAEAVPEEQPEELVTEDRVVLVPQYITKAERHYVTRTIRTPSTRTIYVPVKQIVRRQVPYEVRRIEARRVLVPMSPGVAPATQQSPAAGQRMPLLPPATTGNSTT